MNTIVKEKLVSFKELEQNIFGMACGFARETTKNVLETYDDKLAQERDKKKYRDKGKRVTSIKTVYGEVTYSRRVYQTVLENGERAYIFLLDEAMGMDKIGLISTNLAEKIAMAVTESPFRKGAEMISSTTGESISAMGAWNVVQRLGERISAEEDLDVRKMEAGQAEGEKIIPVLFEEMDGVYLYMQGANHEKTSSREMKVFTAYEGWDAVKEEEGRSTLLNKKMLAGMEESQEFHRKREACIEKIYDADEIGQRVLNGDGGSWIKEIYDDEAIFQLDPYHVQEAITKGIDAKTVRADVRKLLAEGKTGDALELISTYANSVASDDPKDKRQEKANKLYGYLADNREGLIPWQVQMVNVPEPPEGCIYKNMGVQENQNCTLITLRMKHRRMRWSHNGANNMGKALARRVNGELQETIARYTDGLCLNVDIKELVEPLSAAKAPKKDGKGNPYGDRISHHMPLLDAAQTTARKALCKFLTGETN